VSPSTALRSLLADRRGETEAVLGLVRRIASSLDVDEILHEAVRLMARLTGSAGALVYLLDEQDERLWVRAGVDGYEEWIGRFSLELGAGLTGWTALNRTPAIVRENASDDPRYLFVPELNDDAFQSALTYPLISPGDRLVGVVTLHTTAPHEFTEDDLTLVAPLASLVAAAVETAQLYADRTRQLDAVRALATAVEDPSRRRAVHALARSARELVGADGALVALRDPRGRWSVGAVATAGGEWSRPERVVRPALLDPLCARITELRGSRHAELIATLPGATAGVGVPLKAGGETVGVLVCLGRHARLAASVRDVLSAIAAMAAQVVLNARLIDQLTGRNAEREFLEALAAGDEPEAVLAARARRLGIDLSQRHLAVVFEAGEQAPDPEPALAAACEAIRALFPGSACAVRGVEAIALVRVRDDRDLADRLRRACAGQMPIAAGVGSTLDEAQQAVRMGRALHGPASVTRFEDLGVQRYLWSLAQEPARDVWQERLERLRLHDAEHGSRLFETAERYLECNGNRKDAAARLFVHRNTLRQRVDRIRRVAQIDLDDPRTLFDLQVALRIVRYRELTEPRRAHGTSS
jgi:GAF domain-containing protein